jgi:hypothetical protein
MSGTHPQQKYARISGMMETKEGKDLLHSQLPSQLQLHRAGVSLEMKIITQLTRNIPVL